MSTSNNNEDKCKDVKCTNNPCPSYTQRAGKPPIKVKDECCSCEDDQSIFTQDEKKNISQLGRNFGKNLMPVGWYLLFYLSIFAFIIHPIYNTCQNDDKLSILKMLDLGDIKSIKQFSIINELIKLRNNAVTDKSERGLNPGLIIWIQKCIKWNIILLIKWFFYTIDFITGNYTNKTNDSSINLGIAIDSLKGGASNNCINEVSKYDKYILLIIPIVLLLSFGSMWLTFAGGLSYIYLMINVLNKGYFPHIFKSVCRPNYENKTYNECCSDKTLLQVTSFIQSLLDWLYTPGSITNIFPIWSYFLSPCFYEGISSDSIINELKSDIKGNAWSKEIIKFLTIVSFSWTGMISDDCDDNKKRYKTSQSIGGAIMNFFSSLGKTGIKLFSNPISFIGLIIGFFITFIADFIVCPLPIPLPIGLGKTFNWGAISLTNYLSLFWIPFLTASFFIRVLNIPELFRIVLCFFLNIATAIFFIGPSVIIYTIILCALFLVKWLQNIFNLTNLKNNFTNFLSNNRILLTFISSIVILTAWFSSFSNIDKSNASVMAIMLSLPVALFFIWGMLYKSWNKN